MISRGVTSSNYANVNISTSYLELKESNSKEKWGGRKFGHEIFCIFYISSTDPPRKLTLSVEMFEDLSTIAWI